MAATLGLISELYLGSWTDISTYCYQRDPVQVQRGRQNEASTIQAGQASLTLNNRDGRFTTRNPVGAYYPGLVQNTPLRLSVPSSYAGLPCYLRLEYDTASYASCPDSAALQITSGTLSVRVDCKITDWQSNHVLIAKAGATAQSWAMWTNGDGTLVFFVWDGSANHFNRSPCPLPYFCGRIAVRADYNITAGTVTWYTAPSMSGSWTHLGGSGATGGWVGGTPASIASGAGQPVQAGNGTTSLPGMYGEIYEAQIWSTSTLEADPVFTSQTPGATSFSDGHSNTWTLAGTSELSGKLYRFHGEMGSFPKATDPSATDVYSQATAYGVTKRIQNSNTPTNSPMTRAYLRLAPSLNLAGYWPAEDGQDSTSIGSAVGGSPMAILNATPSLAGSTVFACSSALPTMNGASFYAPIAPGTATFTADIVRFLWAVPSTDDTSGAIAARIFTSGTVARMDLVYTTGGNLALNGYSTTGASLFGGTATPGLTMLAKARISIELTQSGSSVAPAFWVLPVGATSATGYFPSSVTGTIGAVIGVEFGGGLSGSTMGQFSVQGTDDNLFDLAGPLEAWTGETAGTRFARICAEEGVACRIYGPPQTSMPMGDQPIDTVANILQDCENTDLGMWFEPAQVNGLGYRTRGSLYNQPVTCSASYSSQTLLQGFSSTGDTQLAVNDVTVQAPDGSTARHVLNTGAMSVQSPPSGIGRIDTQIQANPSEDGLLSSIAAWYLWVRSVNDDRYPSIPFQFARTETPASAALADIGDYVQIPGTPAWLPPGPVRQLTAGLQEKYLPATSWELDINGVPEVPYEVCEIGTSHLDTAGSELAYAVTSTATTLYAATTAGPPWSAAAGDYPFDVVIDGEQITVTAAAAATPSFVQSASGTSATSSVTVTLSSGTTQGNSLVIAFGGNGASASPVVSSISVGGVTAAAQQLFPADGFDDVEYWAVPGVAAGATSIVISTAGGSGALLLAANVMEWANLQYSVIQDVASEGNSATAVSSWSSGATITSLQATEVAFGAVAAASSGTITGPGSPWVNLTQITNSTLTFRAGYNILSARSAVTYSGTFGTAAKYTAVAVTAKPLQALTVTRSVNGIVRAHSAGAGIALYHTPVLAL